MGWKSMYKSLVSKRHRKKSSKKSKTSELTAVPNSELDDREREDETSVSSTASKISKTPSLLRKLSRNSSWRCIASTPFTRSDSVRTSSAAEREDSSLSRIMSRRDASTSATASFSGSSSRHMRRKSISEPLGPNPTASPSGDAGTPSLSRNKSRRSKTPIVYSQSMKSRKSPPIEKKLECTLEDLCFGSVKKIKISRNVIKHPGIVVKEEEVLKIEVKPGWRKGTKITFQGKGDEQPGYLPADIVFLIDEMDHPLFSRDGDNLEVSVEIPLVDALTGCSIPVPLIEGEAMTLAFENIVIYPGYEKVLKGKGMPSSKHEGRRGDLHIVFLINFPTKLSDEQREEAVCFLQDCNY